MKLKSTKCVVLDADGVVINAVPFCTVHAERVGVPKQEIDAFFQGAFQECLIGKADLKDVISPHLSQWKWDGDVESFLDTWFVAEHCINKHVVGMIKLLSYNKIDCYLATNQEQYRTVYFYEQMGFREIFRKIFSSSDMGVMKPNQVFFERVWEEIRKDHVIEPKDIIFFDDSKKNVLAAKAVGIDAHFFNGYVRFANILESRIGIKL